MTTDEYRELYQLLRKYQLQECKPSGRLYNAIDVVLRELFQYYYTQNQEQSR